MRDALKRVPTKYEKDEQRSCAMPLDPQTQSLLTRLNAINFSLTRGMTPERIRRREQSLRQLVETGEVEPVAQVLERSIPSSLGTLPLRIYIPAGIGPFPMLVDFHSGGGVMGDLETEDALCRRLTNQSGWLIISVAYRLAPEYKFPTGLEECYSAICWVAEHAEQINGLPARLAVGGMSAGANLAAVLAHMARDCSGPALAMQILLAPITDFRLPGRMPDHPCHCRDCRCPVYRLAALPQKMLISIFRHQNSTIE